MGRWVKQRGVLLVKTQISILTNDICGPMKEMDINRKVVWGLFGKM